MIRKLALKGVTVFPEREIFRLTDGVNIIVGGNDSGKSQVMKIAYAAAKWSTGGGQRELPEIWAEEQRLRLGLLRVFGTRELSGLTAYNRGNGHAEISISLAGEGVPEGSADLRFEFHSGQEENGLKIKSMPQRFIRESAVFLTAREVLTVYPCYMQAGKRYPELIDGASWDICRALEAPAAEKLKDPAMMRVLGYIEKILSGRLQRQNGRFFLVRKDLRPIEMNLVAEGFKRLGTLGLLIQNGSVARGSTLFWDEPETNLNASHLPALVRVMLALCKAGVQLVITSHSLFLLREMVLQLGEERNAHVSRRFFGLQAPEDHTRGVRLHQADTLEGVGPIASLEAEIEQADRYLNMH